MKKKGKGFTEDIAKFFENPSRESLREVLKNNFGEFPNIDFKENFSSGAKLARHVLAIANSGGGCLVFGVAEKPDKSFEPSGLADLKDKADITRSIEKFLPSSLLINEDIAILDCSYAEAEYPTLKGKKFQLIVIHQIRSVSLSFRNLEVGAILGQMRFMFERERKVEKPPMTNCKR
ncbi:hypothetical protein BH18ACI3_BH18ACI3_20680 [soil metagenome]